MTLGEAAANAIANILLAFAITALAVTATIIIMAMIYYP